MIKINQILGNYQIEKELGKGGFGQVFLARHQSLGTQVAIKVPTHPEYIQSLMSEGVIHHSLQSPHIVKILDVFKESDPPFIVMEYVAGGSLRETLQTKKTLPLLEALTILEHIGKGLKEAHQLGLLHGDIKPENILRSEDGVWKLTDFGLTKKDPRFSVAYSGSLQSSVTKNLHVAGTLTYMAPEALQGKATLQSDLYCLGILLFEMLTGSLPQGLETLTQQIPDLTTGVDLFFARCYTREEKRFATIDDFLQQLVILKKSLQGEICYGSLLARVSAFVLDCCFIALLFLLPGVRLFITRRLAYVIFPALAYLIYFSYFHGTHGRTPGNWLFSLRVVHPSLEPINRQTGLSRTLVGIPSIFTTLGLYSTLLNAQKQTLHDLACNTVVIQEK
ncbi:MAG: protein kinase [Planctomycetota bacterium]